MLFPHSKREIDYVNVLNNLKNYDQIFNPILQCAISKKVFTMVFNNCLMLTHLQLVVYFIWDRVL